MFAPRFSKCMLPLIVYCQLHIENYMTVPYYINYMYMYYKQVYKHGEVLSLQIMIYHSSMMIGLT